MIVEAERRTTDAMRNVCSVCGRENSALASMCDACGAFLQQRVATLDFFATLYLLLEQPARALAKVARSEQKNYVYTLFALSGPFLVASVAAGARAGDGGIHTGLLIAGTYALGFPAGIVIWSLSSVLLRSLLNLFSRSRLSYRAVAAQTAWSLAPFGIVSGFLLLMQFALFGRLLFSSDPNPWVLKPAAFWILFAIQALSAVWSVVLLCRAFSVHGIRFRHAGPAVILALLSVAAAAAAASVISIRWLQ